MQIMLVMIRFGWGTGTVAAGAISAAAGDMFPDITAVAGIEPMPGALWLPRSEAKTCMASKPTIIATTTTNRASERG